MMLNNFIVLERVIVFNLGIIKYYAIKIYDGRLS